MNEACALLFCLSLWFLVLCFWQSQLSWKLYTLFRPCCTLVLFLQVFLSIAKACLNTFMCSCRHFRVGCTECVYLFRVCFLRNVLTELQKHILVHLIAMCLQQCFCHLFTHIPIMFFHSTIKKVLITQRSEDSF